MLRPSHRTLRLETLEGRNMLAAGILQNGWLGILGTNGNDNIQVRMSGGNVRVTDNGFTSTYSGVPSIAILCKAGDDLVNVDDNVTISVWVDAGKGNDWIKTGSGNDVVTAGAGDDTIIGGAGIDALLGDAGNDDIQCGSGNDLASGGKGNDIIYGADGDDVLEGAAGNDAVYGELGRDVCLGRAGNDLIIGGDGEDDLLGEAGNDSIYGNDDNDRIDGGAGKDFCEGNLGDDMLKGGAGVDHLDGGPGNNLLDKDAGKDVVMHGIEADLDLELRATAQGLFGRSVTANYEVMNDNGTVKASLRVQVENMTPNSTVDVMIDKVTVGQITTDNSGHGELVYSTMPTGSEQQFPLGFPLVRPGSKITIGPTLEARFAPSFFVEREIVLPQLPQGNSSTKSAAQ